MNTSQIETALTQLFSEPTHRVIFWHDPGREFAEVPSSLQLDDVTVLHLDQVGALETKHRLEHEDPDGRYLLYAPFEEPDYESDWLLDIRLYSRTFRADKASIILTDLGLKNHHVRPHLQERSAFFDSQDRFRKLRSLVEPDDLETDLDRKMLAVLVKADQAEWFTIVRTLFHAFLKDGIGADLTDPPAPWSQIERFGLDEPFWRTAGQSFGYREDQPSLHNLLIRLFVTDYAHHLKSEPPGGISHFILPREQTANVVICLNQWRDSNSTRRSYDVLSSLISDELTISDHAAGTELESLMDVMTFLDIEKSIGIKLRDRLRSTAGTLDAAEIRAAAARRQDGHWASSAIPDGDQVPRSALHAVYDALVAAGDLFELRNKYGDGFSFDSADTMYRAYETELYRFDQLYRHFCAYADQAESETWSILKDLRADVEACYGNWYITRLSLCWGKLIESDARGLLNRAWQIDEVPNQYEFFEKQVAPKLRETDNSRVFVIISDAFRYEAAKELLHLLNGKYRFQATLRTQLGVVPSYTSLGMASLLPHKTLTYKANGDVLVDDQPTASFATRDGILSAYDGMAVKADELIATKKLEGRELVRHKRVIYIYHNTIDTIGDTAGSEKDTFDAVDRAIRELESLVKHIINNLNGRQVIVTADHGFLFQETPPGTPEKSALTEKPPGTLISKKRYLIGTDLPDHETLYHGSTKVTAGAEGQMEFWVPKGANKFHFIAGARFVHGGIMPQEIVVPILEVREVGGKDIITTREKQAAVVVLGSGHKITTSRHRFELIQMEAVSDRVKPVTLKVAIFEGNDPVTNIETVTFDSDSDSIDDRKKSVYLVLQDREYTKSTSYRLVLRDGQTDIETESVDVTIDRAFTDDF